MLIYWKSISSPDLNGIALINPILPRLFEGDAAWGGGGVPAGYNSKTINDNEMKLGGVVKDYYLINLVWFNWRITSSLHHNDVITVKIVR